MEKIFPVNKKTYWPQFFIFLVFFSILLYFSIQVLISIIDNTLSDLSIFVKLTPLGLVIISLIIGYLIPNFFKKNQALKLKQNGVYIPLIKPLYIPWENIETIEIKDFVNKNFPPITFKDYIFIEYFDGKKKEIWLPPKYYSSNANDLKRAIYSFWKPS